MLDPRRTFSCLTVALHVFASPLLPVLRPRLHEGAAELLYRLAAAPVTQEPTLELLRRELALTAPQALVCQPLPKQVRPPYALAQSLVPSLATAGSRTQCAAVAGRAFIRGFKILKLERYVQRPIAFLFGSALTTAAAAALLCRPLLYHFRPKWASTPSKSHAR